MNNVGFNGPHGLREIVNHRPMDYRPHGKMVVKLEARDTSKTRILTVEDERRFVIMDAYWQPGGGATQEEAEKWLLDWAVIVYGGEV